jgi:hypothetical protein
MLTLTAFWLPGYYRAALSGLEELPVHRVPVS